MNFLKLILRQFIKIVSMGLALLHFPKKVLFRDSLMVFTFHEVTNNPSDFAQLNRLWVTPEEFEKQIKYIQENFIVVDPRFIPKIPGKKPYALITVDDGFISYFDVAVPILTKLQCHSIIFLNMGPIYEEQIFWSGFVNYLQHYNPDFKKLFKVDRPGTEFLFSTEQNLQTFFVKDSREQLESKAKKYYGEFAKPLHLEKVQDNPYVHFGNHLFNHFNAHVLSDNELKDQYNKNEIYLRKLKNYTKLFSYPYGVPKLCSSDRTDKIITDLGAEYIFSSYPKKNTLPLSKKLDRFSIPEKALSSLEIDAHLLETFIYDLVRKLRPS